MQRLSGKIQAMTTLKRIFHWSVPLWLASLISVAAVLAEATLDCPPPATVPGSEAPAQPLQPCYEDSQLSVRVVMRTSEQLTAFYLGREFNRAAIDKILETCIFTPIVHNKSVDVLWLELDEWQISQGDSVIPRIKRDYWPDKWREVELPQAHRSTFGWTLMPEVRDLRLDEGVGGSVVIPMQSTPFRVTMNFNTGTDKQGPVKTVVFEDLKCISQ